MNDELPLPCCVIAYWLHGEPVRSGGCQTPTGVSATRVTDAQNARTLGIVLRVALRRISRYDQASSASTKASYEDNMMAVSIIRHSFATG